MASSLRRFAATGALTLVVVPLALLAAGCGGSGSSAPSTTTTAGASGSASGTAAGGARGAAFAAFASCLKAHGIATTGFGGFGRRPGGASGPIGATGTRPRFDGSGPRGGPGAPGGNLTAAQQKAFATCRSKLPAGTGGFGPGGAGGGRGTGGNPAFAKYTQCLAKHGVKLGSSSAPAVFKKASAACAKLRPVVGVAPTQTN